MRRLGADERALWARVVAGVTPIAGRTRPARSTLTEEPPATSEKSGSTRPQLTARPAYPSTAANDTLDGSWDRRLARGVIAPDRVVDFHGQTLASAHALLDRSLDDAIGGGARVMLLVTGKPPSSTDTGPRRGLIRAALPDWLAASRHRGSIAALRAAHPRHGGAGALYLILRRGARRR